MDEVFDVLIVVSLPSEYRFAQRLRRWLPRETAYALTRWRLIVESMLMYRLVRSNPELAKRKIVAMARDALGKDVDADTHFTPAYKPWDQRICVVPDGDLFQAIRKGRASVVTDRIARFTAEGLLLESGQVLQAGLVVMATGLKIRILGGIAITVDGQPFHANGSMAYKGMMLSGLPNCVMTFGYTNASWTLKSDLTAAWACRLLRYMERRQFDIALARREQGARKPWQVYQNYLQDMLAIRFGRLADGVMHFGTKGSLP
jgi:cation diffusion facilitator CzcD-associated flavoprotein CzcO